MKWIFATLLTTGLALSGCSKKGEEKPAPAPAPVEISDQDLPVETDFENEAETQISAENYKAELDQLDKELAAE